MVLTQVSVGKYRFNIIDNTTEFDGHIICRNFKIGSESYPDCVNVSISYNMDNRPINANIPTLTGHEKCSRDNNLDKGEGSVLMIKTLLRHINKEIPEITKFTFEDYSKLECGTKEEKNTKAGRAVGTHAYPVSLFYFSLAFNGITWYEKHFHTTLRNPEQYQSYREKIKQICCTKESKLSFQEFLAISTPTLEQIIELKPYYERADSYKQFFSSIPVERRCPLVRNWIHVFMAHILQGVFQHTDWMIDVTTMDTPAISIGGKRTTRKKGKHNDSYYCPKGRIYHCDSYGDHHVTDE